MKKRGKRIMNCNCVIPFGVKKPTFEHSALAALTAMLTNKFTDINAAALYVLADMCSKLDAEDYVMCHVVALKNIIDELHAAEYKRSSRWYLSAKASTILLIGFINNQSNSKILDVANAEIDRLAA